MMNDVEINVVYDRSDLSKEISLPRDAVKWVNSVSLDPLVPNMLKDSRRQSKARLNKIDVSKFCNNISSIEQIQANSLENNHYTCQDN
jgi:hypothetical protein